jgi:hypothetical protein
MKKKPLKPSDYLTLLERKQLLEKSDVKAFLEVAQNAQCIERQRVL